jgi:hypothetical protein
MRGIVSLTGTSFDQKLMLRRTDAVPLVTSDADTSTLKAIAGVEILAHGKHGEAGFAVDSFTVLAVDGQMVADGILEEDQGRLFLRTAKGRQTLGNPPAQLRSMVGARVWIGGPLATGPNTYGVIAQRRDRMTDRDSAFGPVGTIDDKGTVKPIKK